MMLGEVPSNVSALVKLSFDGGLCNYGRIFL